ncbi:hypothetical protein FACS1894132_11920 [Clostridia bacterium]|nr:hypothetical protein FACS1894132_11920 [Clostridia bacterium]
MKQKSNRKFKIGKFHIIVIDCVLLGIIALIIARSMLVNYLQEFEDSQPNYTAEQIFADYYNPPDIEVLLENSNFELSQFETKDDLKDYFTQILSDADITYNRSSASVDGKTLKFAVKANGVKFSDFTLTLSDKKTKHKFDLYELDNIGIFYNSDAKVKITIPTTDKAFINGFMLNAEYLTESDIPFENDTAPIDGVNPITFKTYTVNNLLKTPKVEEENRFGVKSELSPTDGVYKANVAYNDDLEEKYGDYVVKAIQTYSDMTHQDATKTQALQYYEPNTEIYNFVLRTENTWDWAHSGSSFENVKINEFYAYDEKTFSCRVSFVQKLHKWGVDDYVDSLDLTVFLREQANGKYLIFAQRTN